VRENKLLDFTNVYIINVFFFFFAIVKSKFFWIFLVFACSQMLHFNKIKATIHPSQKDRNFLRSTYKKGHVSFKHVKSTCFFFLLRQLKKHIRSTCYLNNMCFSHAKRHMPILYVGCKKFPTNRLQEIFVPHKNSWIILLSHMEKARRIPHLSNL